MVPMHAKERAAGLYPMLSTAVARWRPVDPWGRVARGGELQREGKRAVKGWGATRGCHGEQEVAGAGPEWWAALRSAPAALKQRSREVEERVWTSLQNPKISRVPL